MSIVQLLRRIAAFALTAALISLLSPSRSADAGSSSLQTVYTNSQSITINTVASSTVPTTATAYPSNIEVSGMTGNITRVAVTLDGLTHLRSIDVDLLLVGPTGAKFIFLSDAGGVQAGSDKLFTFADDAPGTLPSGGALPSGSYRPTSGDGVASEVFPAPAPAGPYNIPPSSTFSSVYNGTNPNGTWALYAVDDQGGSPGSIDRGWSLTITTTGSPQTFANRNYLALNDFMAPSNPYGTTINVSGVSGIISNLKVTLNGFSHTGPEDVDVLLVSPNGRGVVIMSDTGVAAGPATLTFDDAAASTLDGTVVTGSYKPTDRGQELDTFPEAPMRPYFVGSIGAPATALSNFNGFSPNGDWRLFVVDDGIANSGIISGGWSLDITTVPITPPLPTPCGVPSFQPAAFPAGVNPTNLAVADLNNDGNTDIAVSNQVSNDVSILLGNGNGTFQPQTLLPAGSGPYSIVAGRFNADNNFDIAVTNSGSNSVSVYLGNGNGTFSPPTSFLVGASPISIAAGDLNGDGNLDLAVANFGSFFAGSVSILLGNGTGGFTPGTSVRTRTQPSFVTITNINGDSARDLIVANFGANSVSTFLGQGNGLFQLNQNITVGQGPVAIEVADFFGGDGIQDMVVANYDSDSISQCVGNANGTFSCSSGSASANPISIATYTSIIGGSDRSPVIALSGSNAVRTSFFEVAVGQNPNAVEAGDFNGDGKTDLVTANSGSNNISVLINRCAVAQGNLFDWNGDRRTDYAVVRPPNNRWYNGNQGSAYYEFGRPSDKLVPADYDGDRDTDFGFFRPDGGLWVIRNSDGRPIYNMQFGVAEDIPVPGDYDGDAKADIAVWRPSDGVWYIRRSTDNAVEGYAFGSNGDKPAPADYDGDGKYDFALFRPSTGVWYIRRSSDGQFTFTQFGVAEDKTVSADYDGDGKADIAVFRPSTSVWYVLRSSDGGFNAVGFGFTGDFPVTGDFEGDGKFDYAIWRPSDGVWYVLKSSDGGVSYFQWGVSGDYPVPNAYVR